MDKLIKQRIINFARAPILGWYGHTERMQETIVVKVIYSWKSISKRLMGISNIRWEVDVRKIYTG